jgi:hypothetical protein
MRINTLPSVNQTVSFPMGPKVINKPLFKGLKKPDPYQSTYFVFKGPSRWA